MRAHPRVCGENKPTWPPPSQSPGSSPRVRGKRPGRVFIHSSMGLIPACAGKTRFRESSSRTQTAHPRVCGENDFWVIPESRNGGSSPRVRGKPSRSLFITLLPGLIPACAGKTRSSEPPRGATGAHPRVCGENKELEFYEPAQLGSSPRVRGKPCLRRPGRRTHRLIPACAGKTLALWRFRASFRAHPRVCGENHYRVSVDCNRRGSSPRVRGKPYC